MKTITLLLLLLCATPAFAVPLPILSGTWDHFGTLETRIRIVTSEFSLFATNDGFRQGTHQGVEYCATSNFVCEMVGTFSLFAVDYFLEATPPLGCTPSVCEEASSPARLFGSVRFDEHIRFLFDGEGVAFFDGFEFFHADFGSSVQTPEPATWLLLASGLGVFITRRVLCGTY